MKWRQSSTLFSAKCIKGRLQWGGVVLIPTGTPGHAYRRHTQLKCIVCGDIVVYIQFNSLFDR